MTRVKICGITNIDDALHAVESGADALGFNFYDRSARYIRPDSAASIVSQLSPSVDRVGVFVNEMIDNIVRIVVSVGLTAIQLHGEESPVLVSQLEQRAGLPVIKAFRVGPTFSFENILEYKCDDILLDAFCPDERGGTGRVFDWEMASTVRSATARLYLAGGLSANNVAEAIRTVRPFAVDACSLLESGPGRKDPDKVSHFITVAKQTL
jgi:phosphoribosylanthranilate isomerase